MDVWSLPEIQECRAELHSDMTADEATARFISFGGSVRLVLADRNYTFAKLEQRVSPEHAEPLMHLRLAGLGDDISHKLVHIRVRQHTLTNFLPCHSIFICMHQRALCITQYVEPHKET